MPRQAGARVTRRRGNAVEVPLHVYGHENMPPNRSNDPLVVNAQLDTALRQAEGAWKRARVAETQLNLTIAERNILELELYLARREP